MKKAILSKILCGLASTMFTLNVHAQCLSGWKYYMPIVVTNNTSTALSAYQVKLTINTASLVSASKMISTGDDIRFLDSASCQPMPYWIESGMNTSTTVIWVKLPKLPASAKRTIKMYYDNASASAASNGDSTFLIYDDFNGSSLNTSKWNTYTSNSSGTFTESGGNLTISTNSSGRSAIIRSTASISSPIILESKMVTITGWWPCIAILNSGSFNGYSLAYSDSAVSSGQMVLFNAFAKGGTFGGGLFGSTTSIGTLTGLWQLAWPTSTTQSGTWPGGKLNETFSSVSLGSSVNVSAGMLYSGVGSVTMDWIRARTYASTDATSTTGSETANSGIATSVINRSFFCAGDTLSVPFIIYGNTTLNSGNVFTAQLSDSSGSFASPTNIGTLTSTSAGTISAKIPSTALGYHYHIRVVSNSPAITGSNSPTGIYVPVRSSPSFTTNVAAQCMNGNYFAFTNSTQNAAFYKWKFGDGDSSTNGAANHVYASYGSFTVKLYATTIAGCTDSTSQSVTVYSNPVSHFTINDSVECIAPQSFVFTDGSTISSGTIRTWAWNFGDKSSSASQSPTYTYKDSGTYNVVLKITSDKGCQSSFEKTVRVNPFAGTAFNVNKSDECLNGNSFYLSNATVNNASVSYKWVFGDGNTSSSTSLVYSYATAGTYTVKLFGTTLAGCVDSAQQIITVYPKAVAGFTLNSANQCFNQQSFVLNNTSLVSSGSLVSKWNFGDTSVSSATNATHTYKYPGQYVIKLAVISDKGCTDSITKAVAVNPSPTAPISASGNTRICDGDNVVLFSNVLPGYTYQWLKDQSKITNAGQGASYAATLQGNYNVVVYNSFGCPDTSSEIYLQVYPLPTQPVITKTGRELSAGSAVGYQWNLDGNQISGANSQNLYPLPDYGIYTVTITDNNGCTNTSAPFVYDVSGINENAAGNSVKIYPNPAHELINIDLASNANLYKSIVLTDINGKEVNMINISASENMVKIHTGSLSAGIYLLKLTGNSGVFIEKIVIN